MSRGPRRTIAPLLAALGLATGCAQPGPLARRPMMLGTLKTEVVRLEQEKEGFRRRAAELETENARIADELVKERAAAAQLEERLADARALLDRRGLAVEPSFGDSPPAPPLAEWGDSPRVQTQPAGNGPGTVRKPPFAQIGGSIRPVPFPGVSEESPPEDEDPSYPPPRRDPYGPQGRIDPPARWLPVADTAADAPKL